mmetsp:Transcript_4811/g.30526  ORF Transcript_4811/g.30526 Transcript_4811/m.30526 type:complete len:240 (-) Transcript_4811:148-867(-)
MSLFDECASFFQRFRHFHPHHDHSKSSPTKGRGGQFIQSCKALFGLYESHVVHFMQECIGELDARGIVCFHLGECVHEFGHHTGDFVVGSVIFSVLYVVPTHHLQFPMLVFSFPLQEVHFFQQFPLVFFQLPHVLRTVSSTLVSVELSYFLLLCLPCPRVAVPLVRLWMERCCTGTLSNVDSTLGGRSSEDGCAATRSSPNDLDGWGDDLDPSRSPPHPHGQNRHTSRGWTGKGRKQNT